MPEKGKKTLIEKITELKKNPVKKTIDSRMKEFGSYRLMPEDDIFKELCFCITTANCAAERCIMIQKELGDGFLTLPEKDLKKKLKELGYRFHNRSEYLVKAREQKKIISTIISSGRDEGWMRDWLVKNVKGLGYKEASHFLRNIGFTDVAIIDFHILDLLARYGVITRPKTITKKKYLEIEEALRKLGRECGLNLAELDLYLWYMETGKVLK